MINILPPEHKRTLRAARSNTLLLRYNVALLIAIGFMVLAFGFGYFYLNISRMASTKAIEANQAKQTGFATTKANGTAFKSDLGTAKQIFDNQIKYSSLITKISRTLPPGVVLQSLALDSATFGKPTLIIAKAKSYDAALSLKDAFSAQTELFTDVNLQSITAEPTANPTYPMTVNLNLTINKGAAK